MSGSWNLRLQTLVALAVVARNIHRLVAVLREHEKNIGIGSEDPTIKRPDTTFKLKKVGRGMPKIVLETIN